MIASARIRLRVSDVLPGLVTLSLALHAAEPPVQPMYSWRGINGSGVFPAAGLVTEFWDLAKDMTVSVTDKAGATNTLALPGKPGTRKNIVWRTALPHLGQSAPVVVGNPSAPEGSAAAGRVFLTTEEGWKDDAPQLVCVDVTDGRILWKRPIDHMDAWPSDKAAEGRKFRARDGELWREFMRQWNQCFWDNEHNRFRMRTEAEMEDCLKKARAAGFDLGKYVVPQTVDGKKYLTCRKGVSGGWRGRFYWNSAVPERAEEFLGVFQACATKRYHIRVAWTSEGPYYHCFSSVVSDGSLVYALVHPDAVVCYNLAGERVWVTDLEIGGRPGFYAPYHTDIASPVIVGDKLVIFSAGSASVLGLDRATGKIAWRTPCPRIAEENRDWPGGGVPRGFGGHMGGGGTPVVMRIGADAVVVCVNGLVVRARDGAIIHHAGIPRVSTKMDGLNETRFADWQYGATYYSWVAGGDILFCQPAGFAAIRIAPAGTVLPKEKKPAAAANKSVGTLLSSEGTSAGDLLGETPEKRAEEADPMPDGPLLPQQVLWRLDGKVNPEGPNLTFHNGRLYAQVESNRKQGVAAINAATGQIEAWGPPAGGYVTTLAFGKDRAVWRTGGIGDATEWKADPTVTPGHGLTTFTIVSLPELKELGKGYLCPEAPTGELSERHIACIGTERMVWGNAGVTCWGNRIFVRNNDYLWCIGDPDVAWVPGEKCLE